MAIAQLEYYNSLKTIFGNIWIDGKDESTDTLTGSLICNGGCAIAKNLSLGGALDINGGINVDGDFGIDGQLILTASTVSTNATTGTLICTGGVGISGDLNVLGTITTKNIIYEQKEVVVATDESTSVTSGASVIMGGQGIVNRLNVGGYGSFLSPLVATDSITGALRVTGGCGIIGDLFVGGNINGKIITPTTESTSTDSGSMIISGGLGVAKSAFFGGTINCPSEKITNMIPSTNYTSGCLVLTGGLGVGHNVNVYGDISTLGVGRLYSSTITSSLNSVTYTDGALTVAGGVGIAGDVRLNGTLYGNMNGAITGTSTTQNYIDNTTSLATTAYVRNAIMTQNIPMSAPNGFENQTDSTITYDPSTRIFTITPTTTSFTVWISGVRYVYITPQTLTHANTAGNYYFYFSGPGNGAFAMSTSRPSYFTTATCSVVTFLDATHAWANEERHASSMDVATHSELHQMIGMFLYSGCTLGGYNLSPPSPVDSDNQITLTSGIVSDETLLTNISALSAGSYNVSRLTGAGAVWTYSTFTVPFYYVTTGFINYNQYTGGSWTMTPLTNGNYCNYYVIAVPSLTTATQIFIKPGQNTYSSLSACQAEVFGSQVISSLGPVEFVAIYQISFRASNGYSNLGKCRIEGVQTITTSKNITSVVPQINFHDNLLGLSNTILGNTITLYGHITDAAPTFLNYTYDSTSTLTGSLVVAGGVAVAKQLRAGQTTILSTATNQLTLGRDGTYYSTFNVNSAGALTVDTSGNNFTFANTDVVNVTGTINSSGATTGSLLVTGGVGIVKNVNISGISGSSSITTGSLVVGGGIGCGCNMYSGAIYCQQPENIEFSAELAVFTPANYTLCTLPNVATTSGTVTIAGGLCTLGVSSSIIYNMDANTDHPNLGSIRFLFTPNYNGSQIQKIFTFGTIGSANELTYYQNGDNRNGLNIRDSVNNPSSLTFDYLGWNAGTEYAIEFDYDCTNGNYYMFKNGALIANTVQTLPALTRVFTTTLTFASNANYGFSIRNLQLFKVLLHTASFANVSYAPNPVMSSYKIIATNLNEAQSNGMGSLYTMGGAYISKNAMILSTNNSTSTTTGALIVTGGVGIGGNLYISKNAFVGASTVMSGTLLLPMNDAVTVTFNKIGDHCCVVMPWYSSQNNGVDAIIQFVDPFPTGFYSTTTTTNILIKTMSNGVYAVGELNITTSGVGSIYYTSNSHNFAGQESMGAGFNATYYV